jgi:hypothetical protein
VLRIFWQRPGIEPGEETKKKSCYNPVLMLVCKAAYYSLPQRRRSDFRRARRNAASLIYKRLQESFTLKTENGLACHISIHTQATFRTQPKAYVAYALTEPIRFFDRALINICLVHRRLKKVSAGSHTKRRTMPSTATGTV